MMWSSYNGRILNNYFDMILPKYDGLWAVTSALIHTLTIFVLLKIFSKENSKKSILLFIILVLSVSPSFRAQVQIHKTGNVSYAIPTFLIMVSSYLLLKKRMEKHDSYSHFGIMFLSLAASLWIENLTIGLLLLNICVLFYDYLKNKKINKYTLCSLIGCIIGCLIIFTSPGFFNRYNSDVGSKTIFESIKDNLSVVLYQITLEEKFIYIVYSLIASSLFFRKKRKKYIAFKIYFSLLSIYLITYTLLENFSNYNIVLLNYYGKFIIHFADLNKKLTVLIMMSMLASIVLSINILFKNNNKENLNFLYLLSLFTTGPVIMSPGKRNYIILMYCLFIIIINLFELLKIKNEKRVYILLIVLLLCKLENYHYVLNKAYRVTQDRKRIINRYKMTGQKGSIVLPVYDSEIWGNLSSSNYWGSLVYYYGLKPGTIVYMDDGFRVSDIFIDNKEEDSEIVVDSFNTDGLTYDLKIYLNNNVVLEEVKENDNKFNYNFEKNKKYKIECIIKRSDDLSITKVKEVKY